MKAAAKRTGLTQHVIRIWERRYGAVNPERTGTNRRRYSEEDIRRLVLLKGAVDAGHGIGSVARLPNEKLAELADTSPIRMLSRPPVRLDAAPGGIAAELLGQGMAAVRSLNAQAIESVLSRALVSLSKPILLEQVVLPLLRGIGELWQGGELRVAHEHLTTGVIRTFLGGLLQGSRPSSNRSSVVFATPSGQIHELGALAAAVTAAADGWRAIYLGPNLPAEEIAAAAAHSGARAVCLSLVYPPYDPGLITELQRLRGFLPSEVRIIAGGVAVSAYEPELRSMEIGCLNDISGIRPELPLLGSPGEQDTLTGTPVRSAPATERTG
jgi:DNA-binding transcriptional MerR regulator/methylmalonyl-CoA mutase cobalamin-binding subunit